MNSKSTEQLLIEMENFSRTQNFSKKATAAKLGIPYGTLKKWFLSSSNRREPSRANVQKIEKFLDSMKETNTHLQELWMKILEWWKTQHRYPTIKEFADEIGWDSQSLAAHLQNGQMPSRLVIEKIAMIIGFETTSPGSILQEAKQKTEKIKYLLLLLEDELRWFRDGSKERREFFRESLDLVDVGYISSLLTMLSDEDKFRRWITLTTNRFNFFKSRGKHK